MPNWCANEVVLKHRDPAMIERAVKAYREGRLLGEFIPCPAELHEHDSPMRDAELAKTFVEKYGATDWYNWQVQNWGTKWDIGGRDDHVEQPDANTLELRFDSAWSPPIQGYGRLVELGFEIEAFYNEPGMVFCGSYTGAGDEEFEDYIDYNGWSADRVRSEIPELDQRFCISEWLEECQELLNEE